MPSVDNSQQNSNQIHQKYQPPTHVPSSFTWSQWGNHICVAGSFDPPTPTWQPIEMPKNTNNVNEIILNLLPNKKYFYKFVIDGQWVLDPSIPSYPDSHGNHNHEIQVELPPPPPIPSEEEKEVAVEDQQEAKEQKYEEEHVITEHYQEDKVVTEEHQKENYQDDQVVTEEQKEENQEEKVVIENHQENQVVSEQHEVDQVVAEEQKEVVTEEQKEENQEEKVVIENHQENQAVSEQHEDQVVAKEQKEIVTEEQKEIVTEEQKEVVVEEQKEENQEKKVVIENHQENQAVSEQHEDQVVAREQKEVVIEEQKEENQEEKVVIENHQENQVVSEQHEDQVVIIDQKEHYLHEEDQAVVEDQKETKQIVDGESPVTEEIMESSAESIEVMHTEQSRDNPVITGETSTGTETITNETIVGKETLLSNEPTSPDLIESSSSVSIIKETIIESDNEKFSAEHIANKESIIENTNDIVVVEETPKESQYTSSTSHEDSMTTESKQTSVNPEEIDITKVTEEMVSSNQDEGISSIIINNQETTDHKISTVAEGSFTVSQEKEDDIFDDNKEPIVEQSVIVDEISINESKVTEFVEERSLSTDDKHENITNKDTVISSGVKVSDSTTDIDPEIVENYSTQAMVSSSEKNLEEGIYEPELDPINENEEDNNEDRYNNEDDYNNEDEYNYENEDKNEYTQYVESIDTCPEGVSPETMKEVLLNHTWAKDESTEEYIPSTWLESPESTAYVWSENTQAEWDKKSDLSPHMPEKKDELIQEQVTTTRTISTEENIETTSHPPKSERVIDDETHPSNDEIQSREIPSTVLVEETITEQTEFPSSASINENLESTTVEGNSQISSVEHKTREIVVKETVEEAKESDNEANIHAPDVETLTSDVKVKAVVEPSSVAAAQYEKPESSATADDDSPPLLVPVHPTQKISSVSTTIVANEQDMFNADDVLKMNEKPRLMEKQENFEESQSISAGNIPAGKISQRNIISVSPNASSSGESTRNADIYTRNITVATNSSQEILSPNKETVNIKSKIKKPKEITSREILQRDVKHDLYKLDFSIIYLMTSLATTFTLGIISMLFKSVFETKKNR